MCHILTEIYYILFDCDTKRHTMYVIHQIKNNTATQTLKAHKVAKHSTTDALG